MEAILRSVVLAAMIFTLISALDSREEAEWAEEMEASAVASEASAEAVEASEGPCMVETTFISSIQRLIMHNG